MDFFINAALIALFALALTHLVVHEKGPFQIFWRIKLALLPKEGRPDPISPDWRKITSEVKRNLGKPNEFTETIPLPFAEYMIRKASHQAQIDLWVNTWDGDIRFERTFKGTLFALLDCQYCFSFWANVLGGILVYRNSLWSLEGAVLVVLSVLVGYAIDLIIYRFI